MKFIKLMSRIGKKEIKIANGVEVSFQDSVLSVKGPKGELRKRVHELVDIQINGDTAKVEPKDDSKFANALWGTFASHLQNMIQGVTEGFSKELVVEGVGYKVEQKGRTLDLKVGFSHPVVIDAPEGIDIEVDPKANTIKVSGIDKEKVGQFAAEIRKVKKPEPYKGKGIRYSDERIIRKEGKRATA